MLFLLCVTLAAYGFCQPDVVFPKDLVFEGLGLPDIVNPLNVTENREQTIMIAGDLGNALMTMNFHRYVFHLNNTNQKL